MCTAVDHKQSYHLTDLYYDPLNSLLSSHLIEFHVYGLNNLDSIAIHFQRVSKQLRQEVLEGSVDLT